ncbi:MAG: type II secretion system F family protein [Candidatus Anstonellaceae archaeon]
MVNPTAKQKKVHQPLISQPLREVESKPKEPIHFRNFFNSIASFFPELKKDLIRADMNYTPAGFVQVALINATGLALFLLIVTYLFLRTSESLAILLTLLFPIYLVLSFFYVIQFPKAKANIRAKKIDQELVFAGRHMLIELKSGVPLFDAMLGISQDYGEVSVEFNKIVEKVTLGVPLGVALHEVAENNPSQHFKRVVLQMANSLASGADIAVALEAVLDQISKEQLIELKAYGQKLNPLVMFFMIFGIILPSLGIAFMIILVSFLGSAVAFTQVSLFGFLLAIALVQFIFLTMIESSRPKFDVG